MLLERRRPGIGKLAVALLIIVVAGAAGALAYVEFPPATAHSASFMLDFVPAGFHGLFYYGLDHGLYSASGLDLTILPGSGSLSTISAVAAGKADFGFVDAGVLAYSAVTANVSNVRIVAMVFQTIPYAIIYNTAKVSKFSDLAGKTMGTTPGSGGVKVFAVLAKLNGVNFSSITPVYASAATYNSLVALGRVDFIVGTVNRFPELQPLAKQNGVTLGEFPFASYGLDLYGNALVTTTSMIQSHPDIVKEFVEASLESVQDAAKDPAAAVASVVKYNPQLNYTLSLVDFKAEVAFTLPPAVNTTSNPLTLGWTDYTRMQFTAEKVLEGYGVGAGFNATSIYTNQFVAEPKG